MRDFFLPVILILLLSGCASDRAQVAADARAGIQAAIEQAPSLAPVLLGVDQRLPAVSGVNSADWPVPVWTMEKIKADPAGYTKSAPVEPERFAVLAALSAAGLAALYGIKLIAPLVPGGGSVVGSVADLAWSVLAHKDQRSADKAQTDIVAAAQLAQPVLQAIAAMPPELLPASMHAISDPMIAKAVSALASANPI